MMFVMFSAETAGRVQANKAAIAATMRAVFMMMMFFREIENNFTQPLAGQGYFRSRSLSVT